MAKRLAAMVGVLVTVLQFASGEYRTLTGGGASVKFIANVTDDRGNALTLSNQATVFHANGPRTERP